MAHIFNFLILGKEVVGFETLPKSKKDEMECVGNFHINSSLRVFSRRGKKEENALTELRWFNHFSDPNVGDLPEVLRGWRR